MSKAPCGLDSSPGIVFPVVRHSLMLLMFLLEHSLKQTSSADSLVPPGGAWVRVPLAHTPLSHLSFTLHILPSQTPAPTTPNHPPLLHYPPSSAFSSRTQEGSGTSSAGAALLRSLDCGVFVCLPVALGFLEARLCPPSASPGLRRWRD